MNTTSNRRIIVFLLTLAMLATACGSNAADVETSDPDPTAAPTATALPDEPDDEAVEAGETPDDGDKPDEPEPTVVEENTEPPPTPPNALFSVFTSGGFVPVDFALSAFPELVVMSDGVVYRAGAQIAVFPPPLTPAIERLQLDGDALDEIRQLVSAENLPPTETDYGSPNVTDVATTVVTWQQQVEVTASAYALGFDEGVTASQVEARAKLSALIAAVQAVVDASASEGQLVEPPALGLLTFPGLTFEEDARVFVWPIDAVPVPQPGGADCVVVDGDDLSTVWAAATGATTQTPWNIDGETKVVIFRPVFAHEDFC